jgi:hypothetical protein
MQTAVIVKYLGPTESHGSRWSVKMSGYARKEYSRKFELDEWDDIRRVVSHYVAACCGLDWPVEKVAMVRLDDDTVAAFFEQADTSEETEPAVPNEPPTLVTEDEWEDYWKSLLEDIVEFWESTKAGQ